MSRPSAFSLHPSASLLSQRVVGILHTEACLKKLTEEKSDLHTSGIDLLEVRLDALPHDFLIAIERFKKNYNRYSASNEKCRPTVYSYTREPEHPSDAAMRCYDSFENALEWPLPVIATVRDPKEGGLNNLSLKQREQLFESALPWASIIDVELQSAKELTNTITRAREAQRSVILSYHNFQKTPSLSELQELVTRAHNAGATIFKVATMTQSEEELQRLLAFQQLSHPLPVAAMGMGPLGKRSRPLLAAAGSALVYGYLYEPLSFVPAAAQYSAKELARFIGDD